MTLNILNPSVIAFWIGFVVLVVTYKKFTIRQTSDFKAVVFQLS